MFKNQQTILVTGGAGYIGSHTVMALKQAGYQVLILDNLIYGHRDLVEQVLQVPLIVGDITDRSLLDSIFASYCVVGVIHFAAFAYVGESISKPAKYYANNFIGTFTLLEAMRAAAIKKIVFSSTCATYGTPETIPITEDLNQNPINPYGMSKLMVENLLKDYTRAYGFQSVIFRYFNAAGASPDGNLGEDHEPETHLIPLVLQTALGVRTSLSIFGTDYPTPDGTCIRDYIHVADLAQAHILGLEYLLTEKDSQVFNLGNGNGFSVRQIVNAAKLVTQKPIKIIECDRRLGDPPILIGSSQKVRQVLGWQPEYTDIEDIITHAWQWHQKRQRQKHLVEDPLSPFSQIVPQYQVS
ncbi:MAG TPA: UDP-glucose 4-epimerase GalE [Xenococcaceae cyanobacterium]